MWPVGTGLGHCFSWVPTICQTPCYVLCFILSYKNCRTKEVLCNRWKNWPEWVMESRSVPAFGGFRNTQQLPSRLWWKTKDTDSPLWNIARETFSIIARLQIEHLRLPLGLMWQVGSIAWAPEQRCHSKQRGILGTLIWLKSRKIMGTLRSLSETERPENWSHLVTIGLSLSPLKQEVPNPWAVGHGPV